MSLSLSEDCQFRLGCPSPPQSSRLSPASLQPVLRAHLHILLGLGVLSLPLRFAPFIPAADSCQSLQIALSGLPVYQAGSSETVNSQGKITAFSITLSLLVQGWTHRCSTGSY